MATATTTTVQDPPIVLDAAWSDELERLAATAMRGAAAELGDRLMQEVARATVLPLASAVESGLALPTLSTGKPIEAGTYWEQPLTLSTSGDFSGFYRFLQKVERLPRITRIPDFSLQRDPKADGNVMIEFTLSIFFQQDKG